MRAARKNNCLTCKYGPKEWYPVKEPHTPEKRTYGHCGYDAVGKLPVCASFCRLINVDDKDIELADGYSEWMGVPFDECDVYEEKESSP